MLRKCASNGKLDSSTVEHAVEEGDDGEEEDGGDEEEHTVLGNVRFKIIKQHPNVLSLLIHHLHLRFFDIKFHGVQYELSFERKLLHHAS